MRVREFVFTTSCQIIIIIIRHSSTFSFGYRTQKRAIARGSVCTHTQLWERTKQQVDQQRYADGLRLFLCPCCCCCFFSLFRCNERDAVKLYIPTGDLRRIFEKRRKSFSAHASKSSSSLLLFPRHLCVCVCVIQPVSLKVIAQHENNTLLAAL